jgi:peptide/nickel transport system substrate-binding protein
MNAGRHKKLLGAAAVVVAASLTAAGCGSSSPSSGSGSGGNTVESGGTVTVGQISGETPDWIWPFVPATNYSVANSQDFQWLLYRPLYLFGNNGDSASVNYPLSTADQPVYTDGGKTVTITMKGWKWSDGETVSAADVAFWLNMMKAEKANYGGYTPGTLPDNLASFDVTSPDTIVLHLTRAYASTWFTYNQLAEITPMPLAWDVTSATAAAGSGGCNTNVAKCAAVYNFLVAQTKDTSSYATSPIWGVVDGPWKLSAFSITGNDTFIPNKSYGGSPHPHVAAMKYVTYTDDTTLYTAWKTGTLDIGAPGNGIPPADLPQKPANSVLPATNPLGSGFTLQPAYSFAIYYWDVNMKNPTVGPMFSQLYFRQALQYADDQEGISQKIYRGYAYPTTGPVPSEPPSAFEPAIESANGGQGAYPFNISKAKSLLTSHGWAEVGGVMTCQVPAKCGPGVAKGTQAKFTMDYVTGVSTAEQQVEVYQSDASEAGISISLVGQSYQTVIGEAVNTNPKWEAADLSGWAYDGPGFEPTGEPLFVTNASSNTDSYSSPQENSYVSAIEDNSSMTLFHQYATYTAEQQPFIWFPTAYTVQPQVSNLHGVTYNPYLTFLPEYWYFTK